MQRTAGSKDRKHPHETTTGRLPAPPLPQGRQHRPSGPPRLCKELFKAMDTSRLLLAFLAFGAACTTLWAWMLATSNADPESSGQ